MPPPKNPNNLPVPYSPPAATEQVEADLDRALNGVEGKVRNSVVMRLRKLVDQDPQAFVSGMRRWMHDGD